MQLQRRIGSKGGSDPLEEEDSSLVVRSFFGGLIYARGERKRREEDRERDNASKKNAAAPNRLLFTQGAPKKSLIFPLSLEIYLN